MTDPAAPDRRAQVYVPNPVNKIQLADFDQAVRAEVYIEYWGGHAGTIGKAIRVNGSEWYGLPRLEAIPGDAGRVPSASECYMHYSYATVPLPLDGLLEGENTFEFNSGPQTCHNFGWGQWGVYSVTFRIYYDPDTRAHPTGRILTPEVGEVFADSLVLEAAATSPVDEILGVDFIGLYDDYDFEGNGIWRQWHYFYRYGRIKRHIGSVVEAPYRVEWDTRWVPDQPQPISFVARIRDGSGLMTLTEPVTDVRMERASRSVQMYRPYNVPSAWVSRVGRWRSADVFVPEDLTRAVAARMALTTWSGGHADSVGINHRRIVGRAGPTHDYGYITPDVPLDLVQPGTNSFFTASGTSHHGIEVMWPGIVLFVEYDAPLEPPQTATSDLHLFTDSLLTGWSTSVPSNGLVELMDEVRIGVSSSFRDFFQMRGPPVPLDGYQALRFDVHPGDLRIASYNSLYLVVWGEQTVLMSKGEGQRGLDFQRPEWQTVEIPLDELFLRQPYLESIGFRGLLSGDLRIDNVRLVAEPVTAVVDGPDSGPALFSLEPAFPNPFNAIVNLSFHLPQAGQIEISIYNLMGQRVATAANDWFTAGRHTLSWDGIDDAGHPVATGVYFVRSRFGQYVELEKILLLQ